MTPTPREQQALSILVRAGVAVRPDVWHLVRLWASGRPTLAAWQIACRYLESLAEVLAVREKENPRA